MNKVPNFVKGDIVRILPTATRQKYIGTSDTSPGWLSPMSMNIGQIGTVAEIYYSGNIRVIVPATGGKWTWMPEDLELVKRKWRRTECR